MNSLLVVQNLKMALKNWVYIYTHNWVFIFDHALSDPYSDLLCSEGVLDEKAFSQYV